jgi:hypothetical protein
MPSATRNRSPSAVASASRSARPWTSSGEPSSSQIEAYARAETRGRKGRIAPSTSSQRATLEVSIT